MWSLHTATSLEIYYLYGGREPLFEGFPVRRHGGKQEVGMVSERITCRFMKDR